MELRSIKLFNSNETTEAIKILGKTVFKNVSQLVPAINFNIEINKSDLQKLYDSVDLTNKLVVLEDLERSHIDIIELLGYINNFVEQDNVKVLLVANETEILLKDSCIDLRNDSEINEDNFAILFREQNNLKSEKNSKPKLSEYAKKYILIKEKTISDTIQYKGNYADAVSSIITSFDNKLLLQFKATNSIDYIARVTQENRGNLRSFIFACQKTVDIFNKINKEYSFNFLNCIFISNIQFSMQLKQNNALGWDGNQFLSTKYSAKTFPLFKFSYDYITLQIPIKESDIDNAYQEYQEYCLYEIKSRYNDDPDLNIVFAYYINTEKDVLDAIHSVHNRLRQKDINLYSYGYLASYIIDISQYLDFNLNSIKKLLVDNLREHKNKLAIDYLFGSSIQSNSAEKRIEYQELKEQMCSVLKDNINIYEIEYSEIGLKTFCDNVSSTQGTILGNKKFLIDIDIERFVSTMKDCATPTLQSIRSMFSTLYSTSNIGDFLSSDAENMLKLINAIEVLIEKNSHPPCDRFWLLQLEWMRDNLKGYYKKS
ncbi:MAG: hypothetical protein R3Y58_10855 [Eubacteriales bacterium]